MGRDGKTEKERSTYPQPPPRDELGPCSQCVREGGIVLYGKRRLPQQAVIHPNHVHLQRDDRGRVGGVARKGPREPLCSWHAELGAWKEHKRRNPETSYPEPAWRGESTVRKDAAAVIARIRAQERGENQFAMPTPPDPHEVKQRFAEAMREPGDESDEVST